MIAIDLFAGTGGLSEGARQAGIKVTWAANHSELACTWYERNHGLKPECQDLQQADFRDAPSHDLLLAAPSCQGHSPARGVDRPHHDAYRATAWAVVTCAEVHRPQVAVIENVPEMATRWVLWRAWCTAWHDLGYALAPMVLNAADHGVPQDRERLIIVATRSRYPIELDLPALEPIPAAKVIDWSAGKWSRVDRPGRKPATLRRVANGRAAFGDRFLMPYYGSGSGLTGRSLHRPIGTLTTKARWAVVNGDSMRMVSVPEARAFMGFPETWELPRQVAAAHQLLGNAVAPPKARRVLQALRAKL